MKTSILRQYRTALSKSNAMHVYETLYFEHAEPRQIDDTETIKKAKIEGFKLLRKLGQINAANQILKF